MLYRGAVLGPRSSVLPRFPRRAGQPKASGGKPRTPKRDLPGTRRRPFPRQHLPAETPSASVPLLAPPCPDTARHRCCARHSPRCGSGLARPWGSGWGRGERAGAASRPQPALRRRRHLGRARAPPPQRRKWRTRGREGSRGSLSAEGSAQQPRGASTRDSRKAGGEKSFLSR